MTTLSAGPTTLAGHTSGTGCARVRWVCSWVITSKEACRTGRSSRPVLSKVGTVNRLLLAWFLVACVWSTSSHAESGGDSGHCVSDIATRLSPTRDFYHGVAVDDPY